MKNNGKKGQLLSFVSEPLKIENSVEVSRIFCVNKGLLDTNEFVYLTSRDLRVEDNFAINFLKEKTKNFSVVHLKRDFDYGPKQTFYEENLSVLKENYALAKINFEILDCNLKTFLKKSKKKTLVIDFNPLENFTVFENYGGKIYEIDSHNIVPARIASPKQEYNAFTFRRKIYNLINYYLTEMPQLEFRKNNAYYLLEKFITTKLEFYKENKNNPNLDVTSNLSPYLNFGFISPQRVAIEVIKSQVLADIKEEFLEELIVRAELADNFCLYNPNYKSLNSAPEWAKKSLKNHEKDLREYIYSKEILEKAMTHDDLWNACQIQLLNTGKIHGYLRMYWAKQILRWTKTAQEALDIANYLNDKYAYDGISPNGYIGILWSIAGLHDRAFKEFSVTGKVRRMNGLKSKAEKDKFIQKYVNQNKF